MRRLTGLLAMLLVLGAVAACADADTYVVTLDEAAADAPQSGRLMVFFIAGDERRLQRRDPIDGPFFSRPQPIASVAVEDLAPGAAIEITGFESSFPLEFGALRGPMRVQAMLDVDETLRSHRAGPGNIYSDVVEATLTPGDDDRVELVLKSVVEKREPPETQYENIRWVEVRSELLSAFYGRDVHHRAGVAFPLQYFDKSFPQRDWPTIYDIPGYGGRHFGAVDYAEMFHQPKIEEVAPMAVTVVLDPDSPLGHHGFVDSPNHGPRGTALVTELIPYLEKQFRLVARPEARLVTGHSSGGWSSLWLQLRWPDVFGGCWSTAPDPIDFHTFQMTDLYEEPSMYVMPGGEPTPSMRYISGPRGETSVAMTVRQEALMEWAMHPHGGSGQQWDAWEAMFSPHNDETGLPRQMFDPRTGRIDKAVVEHWSRFDITKLVAGDWDHYGPIITGRVRLMCGELDSYYLNRAVERFKAIVEAKRGDAAGPGYIRMVEFADHGSLRRNVFININEEMRAHLREAGLHPW